MVSLNLSVFSKNFQSLQLFLNFFSNIFLKKILLSKKLLNIKKKKKVISLLASPHVNKNAQEQFELKLIKSDAFLSVTSNSMINKFILFFKKIKQKTFADIKLKFVFFHKLPFVNNYVIDCNNQAILANIHEIFITKVHRLKLFRKLINVKKLCWSFNFTLKWANTKIMQTLNYKTSNF